VIAAALPFTLESHNPKDPDANNTMTSVAPSEEAATAKRPTRSSNSLRRRLPALIFALVGMVGATFAWMAYHEVQAALRVSGTERITAAARQVAELLGQSASTRIADATRLASDPQVRRLALSADVPPEDEVPAAVQAFVSRNPLATVWLCDQAGRPLGRLAAGAQAPPDPGENTPPPAPPGVSPLRSESGRVWFRTTVPIAPAGSDAPSRFLSVQRALGSSQAAGLIERLIGSGVALKFGNASGSIWTDLSAPTTVPPATTPGNAATYFRPNGEKWIGIKVPVTGTPWLVWVEVAEHTMLGPARVLLRRMLPITLVLMVLGALAVYGVSRHITTPLEQVTEAAEAIAGGDYTRRVSVARGDEIGRLGTAFNVMAGRVAGSHDTLERRVGERTQQLEQAREELDRFFSLSLDLLCIAGLDGRFRRVNPAWERLLGWTPEDLLAAPYLDFVHPDDRALTAAEADKLSSGAMMLSFENRYRCKDGSYRWLSWKAVPVPAAGLLYAVAHDVTEQKKFERALHDHASDLANANRELEAFSYSVSHDLRAPLRHIDGYAQALSEDCSDRLDAAGQHFLARIRAGAQRMGVLIDDLLSLSRVTRAELTCTDVDLTIAARLQEHDPGRTVAWRIEPGLKVRGDAPLLGVALDNLLGNAWKFTSKRPDAAIEFSAATSPTGDRMYVVRDNGAGFDMAHADKLFGAFQRLHGVAEFPGTGIGLATVQRIIRRHGGRIWAESSVGQGATFSFTLGVQ
jgi:PAS domain S-box-containing protein